jgi:hypothetical protein
LEKEATRRVAVASEEKAAADALAAMLSGKITQ